LGSDSTQRRLIRYLPHAILATCAVTGAPVAFVATLEHSGAVDSTVVAIILGIVTSICMAAAGSWLWARHPGARDIVFGDLILWGFLRRVRTEKTIPQMIDLLSGEGEDSKLSPKERIAALKRLASALEASDPYTHGHTERVARHAYMIAKTMGLSAAEVRAIRTAAAVHDVGKIHVPNEVLNKPGKLTDEEFALMKGHSAAGAEMVQDAGDDQLTALVRHHHERIDGRGYPDGLAGDAIPLGARIIAVADTFDAITSTRSYRTAKPHRIALDILKKEAGTQLDPDAVKAFLSYYSGKRSRTWWASMTTVPQRLVVRLMMWLKDAGVAQLANAAVATGAAVAVGGTIMTGGAIAPRPTADDVARTMNGTRVASATVGDESDSLDNARRGEESDHNSKDRDKHGRDRTGNGGGKDDDGGKVDPGDDGTGGDTGDDTGGGDDPGDPPSDDGGGPVDDIVDTVDDTVDDANEIVDDATDTVDDVVDDATDTVDDVVDGAGDTVDDLIDAGDSLLP
jgi:HD-GYP domain-containing protein (c-di-GMP phosphodiesterase class II)